MNWESYAWIVWLMAFVTLEAIGLTHRTGMTLTFFIEHHLPRWALACFLGWLVYHFLIAPMARG